MNASATTYAPYAKYCMPIDVTGLRGARRQPAHQHEGAEDEYPVEAEHEARDLSGETGLEQPELDQDEAEDAPDQMGVGPGDENTAAIHPT